MVRKPRHRRAREWVDVYRAMFGPELHRTLFDLEPDDESDGEDNDDAGREAADRPDSNG